MRNDINRPREHEPIGFFIQAISFSDLVEYRLFERGLDVVKDMENEVFLGPKQSHQKTTNIDYWRPTYRQGWKRGARLNIPLGEINGWNISVINWTVGGRSG